MLKKIVLFLFIAFCFGNSFAQTIPTPKSVIGFTPGDDRKLASWNQVLDYFKKLDTASDRVKFEEIGKTTIGVPFVYATISSPANLKNLEKYKQINQKLADPRLIKSNEKLAQSLIKQGKTIVLITCGIHSNEVGSYLSSMLIAEKLANATDAETLKILDETIILLVPSLNPDGVDIIKNWYDKTLGTPYEGTDPPELYHKYVGHDNNRDWYAFTQVETQLTVDKIHNVWHPQIVNDIHQQGSLGARLFLPPYTQPVEPNVPKQIVEGYTELGNYVADEMRSEGFQGITTDSTYDAWTPARAYSHYHGGVRILSETASAKLATRINVEFERLRGDVGYDAKKESPNYRPLWKGGEWHLRDITNYMTTAAFKILKHASANREKWLSRFYSIGKEAVRPRKDGELLGFKLNTNSRTLSLLQIFERAGVEYGFQKNGKPTKVKIRPSELKLEYSSEAVIVPFEQPYGGFAKAILQNQVYPNLLDEKGVPISPYDVTAHTMSLMLNVKFEEIKAPFRPNWIRNIKIQSAMPDCMLGNNKKGLYKSHVPTMDEGWTRWTLEKRGICEEYDILTDKEIRRNHFEPKPPLTESDLRKKYAYNVLIFPDQSPKAMLEGHPKGTMSDEYTGGIGKEGVANLKKFVEDGGTLVFLNRASDFAIEQFNLPIKDVTFGLNRKDFFIPGSILRTELDINHKIAKGMEKESIAWFENSPAFEVLDKTNVEIIAKYPDNPKDILLSGWALGTEKIAGKAALAQVNIGKGKIILFGFRPQYRGQSLATFPLFFNAIAN
jgi:Zinc carboxypeptidase